MVYRSESSSPVLSRSRRTRSFSVENELGSNSSVTRKKLLPNPSCTSASPAISKAVNSLQLCCNETQKENPPHYGPVVAACRPTSPRRSPPSKLAQCSADKDMFDDSFDDLLCTVAAQVESQYGTASERFGLL